MNSLNILEGKELILNEGKLVDASFAIAPRKRNTREENDKIKRARAIIYGMTSQTKSHKDIEARWTKKNNETFYG